MNTFYLILLFSLVSGVAGFIAGLKNASSTKIKNITK